VEKFTFSRGELPAAAAACAQAASLEMGCGRRLGHIARQLHSGTTDRAAGPLAAAPGAAADGTSTAPTATVSPDGQLSEQTLEDYVRDGFAVIDGLIPEPVLAAAEAATWDLMAGVAPQVEPPRDPRTLVRGDCESWVEGMWAGLAVNAAINAAITPGFEYAAQQLISAMHAADPARPPHTSGTPGAVPAERMLFLNTFPQKQPPAADSWAFPPEGHVDVSLITLDRMMGPDGPLIRPGERPLVVTIQTIVYLTTADGEEGGGATVVFPRSHRKLREMHSDMWSAAWEQAEPVDQLKILEPISRAAGTVSREIKPLEVLPKRGRVVFYDTLCAHSGSANVQTTPRLAFAQKW